MKKSITVFTTVLSALAGVSLVSAQVGADFTPIQRLVVGVQSIVSQLVPLLIGLAVLSFFYGLVMFLWKGKEGGEALTKAKQFMTYSLVAIFVMVSIWGIIYLLQVLTGTGNVDRIVYPKV